MPIFEYLCHSCNRIYSFLSLSPRPGREPVCPRCGATGLSRVPSAFAVSSSRSSEAEPGGDADSGAMDRLEQEAMRMAGELDEKDAEDPRVMARMMRRLADASGEPVPPAMEEMLRRLEAGEDPDALEEELGPRIEEEMGDEDAGGAAAPTRDDGLYSL